jgi:hypothetical protein
MAEAGPCVNRAHSFAVTIVGPNEPRLLADCPDGANLVEGSARTPIHVLDRRFPSAIATTTIVSLFPLGQINGWSAAAPAFCRRWHALVFCCSVAAPNTAEVVPSRSGCVITLHSSLGLPLHSAVDSSPHTISCDHNQEKIKCDPRVPRAEDRGATSWSSR